MTAKTTAQKEVKKAEQVAEREGGELSPHQPSAIVPVVADNQVMMPADFKSNFSRKQIEVIKEQFAKGASDVELQTFIYVCRMTKLDPFSKQIHLVPRWDSKLGKDIRVVVVGIDGLRSIAERTGAYAGNSDPIYGESQEVQVTRKDWKTKKEITTKVVVPSAATVTVKKVVQGVICDFTATAKWAEYYPGDKQGHMWTRMPENMLGKCAEAKALRKAFPAVMSGLYVGEEVQQGEASPAAGATATDYDRAKGMISKITDIVGLGELRDKIGSSTKYSAGEKKDLVATINKRVVELQGKEDQINADADKDTKDAKAEVDEQLGKPDEDM